MSTGALVSDRHRPLHAGTGAGRSGTAHRGHAGGHAAGIAAYAVGATDPGSMKDLPSNRLGHRVTPYNTTTRRALTRFVDGR